MNLADGIWTQIRRGEPSGTLKVSRAEYLFGHLVLKGFRRYWLEPENKKMFDEKVKCIEKNVDDYEVEVRR